MPEILYLQYSVCVCVCVYVCVCACEWKREEVCYVREKGREVPCACVTFPTAVFS